jgi:TatD DNase family protein
MLLDIHTHQQQQPDGVQALCNLRVGQAVDINAENWYSVGIHPWDSDSPDLSTKLDTLQQLAQLPQVKAIGEIGLDRLRGAPLPEQISVFLQQVALAQALQKPVVVHCVRAFPELIQCCKSYIGKVDFIVHGFQHKLSLGQQLLDAGFNLSFGDALLYQDSAAQIMLRHCPIDRLCLETDDRADLQIQVVYEQAARILGIPIKELIEHIWQNWARLNGHQR